MEISEYRSVFYPKSIIVVGASEDPLKFGGMFLDAQKGFGYKGDLYPVNPKGGIIQGTKAYQKVEDVPDGAEFAVIALPSELVEEAVEQVIRKGVKGIQILSAGFKESGRQGELLEARIKQLADNNDVKLIGPNCFGVYSPKVGMTLMPGVDFPKEQGSVGFFSQSGGGACDVIYSAFGRGVKFSLAVSYGNASGIGAEEMLEYFADDPETKVVGGYVEGIKDGRRFFKALRACAAKKPVIIFKSGLTDQGQKGAAGHTGSMAGSRQAWDAAFQSAGAVAAENMKDLAECLMAFCCLKDLPGMNVGIMAGGGARVVEGLDAASEYGFLVPDLDSETIQQIEPLLPAAGGRAGNPIDLANPNLLPTVINPAMEALASCKEVDFLLMYQMLFYSLNAQRRLRKTLGEKAPKLEFYEEITQKARTIRERYNKPLALVLVDIASDPRHFEMEHGRLRARQYYTKNSIPCFDNGYQAFSVLKRVYNYYRYWLSV